MAKITTTTTTTFSSGTVKVTVVDGHIRSTTTGGGPILMRTVGELLIEAANFVEQGAVYHGYRVGERVRHGSTLYEVVPRPTNSRDLGYPEEWIPVRYVEGDGSLGRRNGVRGKNVTRV